jgi:GWxTD domain-containing protein
MIVDRKSTTKNVIVDSYNSTLSQTNYLEGVLKLDLGRNDYTLNSSASLSNGDNNIPLDSILLSRKEIIKSGFLKPIIVMKDKSVCSEEFPFRLINFANTIPFIAESVDMLLPVIDTSVTQIGVKIEQEKKIIIEKKISENYKSNLAIKECDNKISFEKAKNGSAIKYFHLPDFNQNLKEGPVIISVTAGKSTPVDFNVRVVWNDKPKSLATPELAIQILRAIESEEVVDSILSADKDQYNIALSEYWNKKFPNKNSVFNKYELEFYRRADQAIEKFTTLAVKNGALSDRGKTYIRYGEPDEIKRDYNNDNMAIEIWYYDRTNKAFLFTDKTGLGNFTLGQ